MKIGVDQNAPHNTSINVRWNKNPFRKQASLYVHLENGMSRIL